MFAALLRGVGSYLGSEPARAPTVVPVDECGNQADVTHYLSASLEAAINRFEGGDHQPVSLRSCSLTDCRIKQSDFEAIQAFEIANPELYENAHIVERQKMVDAITSAPKAAPAVDASCGEGERLISPGEIPISPDLSSSGERPPLPVAPVQSVAAQTEMAGPLACGLTGAVQQEDGIWHEDFRLYLGLHMVQLYAHWWALVHRMPPADLEAPPWPQTPVRFAVGSRVQCQVVPGRFCAGTVRRAGRCGYIEPGWSTPAPYQVQLDQSEVDELVKEQSFPVGHPGLISAPYDIEHCIRAI